MMRRPLAASLSLCFLIAAVAGGCGGNETAPERFDGAAGPAPDGTRLDGAAGRMDTLEGDAEGDAAAEVGEPPAATTAFPWSLEATDEACGDGVDGDADGYADCDDYDCSRNAAVTVCDAEARYEASPRLCTNGADDDGDGLTDCADPDCAENPFHASCARSAVETDCAGEGDTDGDGLVGCADTDCLWRSAECGAGGRKRVLFDQTLDETAAAGPGSDWVIDASAPHPTPSDPGGADEWSGALSSFAYELHASGQYLVESLPAWSGRLSFGDEANAQDLSRYDVLVIFEPSRRMTAGEKQAVIEFVRAGGGLLAVANHEGADRDGNGYAAPHVFDDWFDDNPVGADPFGFRFDRVDLDTGAPLDDVRSPEHPVLSGAAGAVERLGFFNGCTARLTGRNPSAVALVVTNPASDGTTDLAVGAVEVGSGGRVVFVTDSAIAGDGTTSHGDRDAMKDAWHDAEADNATLFLNAIDWLAHRS